MIKNTPMFINKGKEKHESKIQTTVSFGHGTVRIGTANRGHTFGIVGFKAEKDPREIGAKEKSLYPDIKTLSLESEVILTFKNIKSLDVVIENLQWVRDKMEKNRIKKENEEQLPIE